MTAYFDLSLAGESLGRLQFQPIDVSTIFPAQPATATQPEGSAPLNAASPEGEVKSQDGVDLEAWGKELSRAFNVFSSLCRSGQNGRSIFLGAQVEELLLDCWVRVRIPQRGNLWDTHLKHPAGAAKDLHFPVFRACVPPVPNLEAERGEWPPKSHSSQYRRRGVDTSHVSSSFKLSGSRGLDAQQLGREAAPRVEREQRGETAPKDPQSQPSVPNAQSPALPVQSPLSRLDVARTPCLARKGTLLCDPNGSELYICLSDLPWIDPRVFLPIARVSPTSDVLKRLERKTTLNGELEDSIEVVGAGRAESSAAQ